MADQQTNSPVSVVVDPLPRPSNELSQCEHVDQFMKYLIPESTRDNLMASLAAHGTVARAALSLSNSDK